MRTANPWGRLFLMILTNHQTSNYFQFSLNDKRIIVKLHWILRSHLHSSLFFNDLERCVTGIILMKSVHILLRRASPQEDVCFYVSTELSMCLIDFSSHWMIKGLNYMIEVKQSTIFKFVLIVLHSTMPSPLVSVFNR
jgi:hypothetical protein